MYVSGTASLSASLRPAICYANLLGLWVLEARADASCVLRSGMKFRYEPKRNFIRSICVGRFVL